MRLLIIFLLLTGSVQAQIMPGIRVGIGKATASAGGYTYSDTTQFITAISNITATGWINLDGSGSAPHTTIKDAVSGTTGIGLSTYATANWIVFGASTSNTTGGEDTDDGGGFFFPSNVQRSNIFSYSASFTGSNWKFEISGLDMGDEYVIQLMSSRDAAAVSTATREMRAVCSHLDGQTEVDDFDVKGNTSEAITFTGVKPKTGGLIHLWIGGSGTDATDQYKFGYANGIRIYKRVAN